MAGVPCMRASKNATSYMFPHLLDPIFATSTADRQLTSMMVSPKKWRSGNWKTMPTTAASWLVEVAVTVWPARCSCTQMVPAVGAVSPATICTAWNVGICYGTCRLSPISEYSRNSLSGTSNPQLKSPAWRKFPLNHRGDRVNKAKESVLLRPVSHFKRSRVKRFDCK
jgi:hypothetical protein